jgi:hypothetical protein
VLKLSGVGRVWAIEPVAARRVGAAWERALRSIRRGGCSAADLADTGKRSRRSSTARRSVGRRAKRSRCARGGRVVFTGIPQSWKRRSNSTPGGEGAGVLQVPLEPRGAQARDLLAADPRRFAGLITHRRPPRTSMVLSRSLKVMMMESKDDHSRGSLNMQCIRHRGLKGLEIGTRLVRGAAGHDQSRFWSSAATISGIGIIADADSVPAAGRWSNWAAGRATSRNCGRRW